MSDKKSSGSEWHKLGLMDLAYILPATTIGGWLLGRYLQNHTSWPHWEVTGVALGGLAGLAALIQRVLYIARQDEEQQDDQNSTPKE